MVRVTVGDIFKSKTQTLVNTVNCVGIMGKGIALGFKKRFPEMFEDYVKRCEAKEVKLGYPYLFRQERGPWILNFPTKDHWRSVSRLQDIVEGLDHIERHYKEWGITSLAVPPLGCGEGQLEWEIVGPTLNRYLKRLDIPVELFAPHGTPNEQLQLDFLEERALAGNANKKRSNFRRIKPGWVAIVKILAQVEEEPYHWPVGRTIFEKMAYFATASGIDTELEYQRASYGPHARDFKQIMTRLVNHELIREESQGRMFAVKVGSTFEDACKAHESILNRWQDSIDKIADLFMRMDTKQAELAATVHYATQSLAQKKDEKPTEKDVLNEVMNWKIRRRPPLEESDVATTIRNLSILHWLDVLPSEDLPVSEVALLDL